MSERTAMKEQKRLGWAVILMLSAPVLVLADLGPEEMDQNRRQLEEWRQQPEHVRRLRMNAKFFFGLAEERRQKIERLDRDLHKETVANQARLARVMDRYADWLDQQDEKDRQRIKDALDKNARVAIIKEIRGREWMKYQPKALRDQYERLEGPAGTEFVAKLRLEERQRRLEWRIAARFWKELEKGVPLPSRLADFSADVHVYVTEYLRPILSKEEQERLEKAQGQWPLYPLTLVELADRHPPALPGEKGPKSFAELPAEVRNKFKLKNGNYPPKLLKAERHWPGFAVAIANYSSGKKFFILPHELWAWGHSCLSRQMQEFVEDKLNKAMDNDDKLRLIRAEGKWPDFPTAIQEIAQKHNLPVPWHTLPGNRERWDRYRLARAD
jgi:hypothetical protein